METVEFALPLKFEIKGCNISRASFNKKKSLISASRIQQDLYYG